MKIERLNLHYETLFYIVDNRYDGVTPKEIKEDLILHCDMEIENPIDNHKSEEEKREDYIKAEVTKALKALTKTELKEDLNSPEDMYLYFYDDDDITENRKNDYVFYPHSIIIGVPQVTKTNKESQRNAYYRLNSNIRFNITNQNELKFATKYLYLFFTNEETATVYDDMVKHITKQKTSFDYYEYTTIVDTMLQISLHKTYNPNQQYSLNFLLMLISLEADINIIIDRNKRSLLNLKNIKLQELVFGTDTMTIVSDDINVKINDINEITLIESSSNNTLQENINQTRDILSKHTSDFKDVMEQLINNFVDMQELFFQDY